MGNVLAQCQKVSLDQCELCTEVLPHLGRRHRSPANRRPCSPRGSNGSVGAGTTASRAVWAESGTGHVGYFYPDPRAQGFPQSGGARPGVGSTQQVANEGSDFAALQEAVLASHASLPAEFRGMFMQPLQSEDEIMAQALLRKEQEEETRQRALLREEQDREYQESLRIDQQRQEERRLKQEEEDARLKEAEQKREEEEHARARAEEEEQAQRERVQAVIEEARARLKEEPSPEEQRSTLLIRTPEGKALKRVFRSDDPVSQVYDFCISEGGELLASHEFRLITTMPREVYEDQGISLGEAGLKGQCALLVEMKDPAE